MGKATGFLDYDRKENAGQEPLERIKTYREFHTPMEMNERKKQAARCMDCGVPFCQYGKPIGGMVSGMSSFDKSSVRNGTICFIQAIWTAAVKSTYPY